MRSTMMDLPLQISRLLEHGSTVHGRAEVVTWTGEGVRRTTFAELGAQAALSVAPVAVHRYEYLLRDKPTRYDWPDVDERDAAALCYTFGTTGNPKGVAYSHRSIWLHSMQVCQPESFGLSGADKVLAIV